MNERIDVKKSRFRDAGWFEKADNFATPVIVGGAGGIGSWLVLFLSRILNSDKCDIYLYDHDTVEEINMAGQLYATMHIGIEKPEAVRRIIREFSKYESIIPQSFYDKDSVISPVMFSCFDNMKARKIMFEKWKKEAIVRHDESIFIDGRLLAEQLQVFFVTPDRISLYEKYLFDDKDVPDANCSYKQTSHFAATIAAKMVQGFTNWLTGGIAELPFYYEEIGSIFFTATKDK